MRDAKLEAMGLAPQEERKPRHDKPQMATDEMVRGTVLRWSWYGMVLTLGLGHGTVQETDAKIAVFCFRSRSFDTAGYSGG